MKADRRRFATAFGPGWTGANRGGPRTFDWDEAARLYREGRTFAEVGELLGVNPDTVEAAMATMGVRREPLKRRCVVCREQFTAQRTTALYCSQHCRAAASKRRREG